MPYLESIASPVAEQYVLGAAFIAPRETFQLLEAENVTSDWFYVPRNRYMFEAMLKLKVKGASIEIASVLQAVNTTETNDVIGKKACEEYISICKDIKNVRYYIGILKDKLTRRVIHQMVVKAGDNISSEESTESILGDIKWTITGELPENKPKLTVDDHLTLLTAGYKRARIKGTNGYPSRFRDVQAKTGGYPHGKIILIGARPKVGKTIFMVNETLNLADVHKVPVGVIELEMKEAEIRERYVGDKLGIELFKYRSGKATDEELSAFIKCGRQQAELPITIFDGVRTIENICMLIRDNASRIPFFALDYVQRISQSKYDPRSDRERLDRYSNMLTDVANETGATIMVLAQLNREAEFDHKGKRCLPQARHLKGTGTFEQDAQQVILLARDPELVGDQEWADNQPTVCRVALNRSGGTGDVPLVFQKSKQRFVEKWEHKANSVTQ